MQFETEIFQDFDVAANEYQISSRVILNAD